jgi:hypothetical protein
MLAQELPEAQAFATLDQQVQVGQTTQRSIQVPVALPVTITYLLVIQSLEQPDNKT